MKINIIKQTIVTLGLTCCLWMVGGCTLDEKSGDTKNELQVEATINSSESKAYNSATYDQKKFVEGDIIGINKGETIDVSLSKKYQRTGEKWIPQIGNVLTVTAAEKFSAYYPLSHNKILEDQTSAENYWLSNKLEDIARSPVNNLVAFQFAPAYSKITLNVTYEVAREPNPASITGDNIINVNSSQTIKLYRTSGSGSLTKHSYVGILMNGKKSLTITIGENEHTDTQQRLFESGNNYIFNFTSKNNLILNGVQIKPFTSTDETDAGSAM